jgi:G-patch domain
MIIQRLTIVDSVAAAPVKVSNIGDNDVSPDNTPSQFLLFRGLEPSVTEELFAKGVTKLFKPTGSSAASNRPASKKSAKVASTTGDANLGAREGTLRRILLVRDRRSNESWRYGFAEFATIDDAQAAVVRYNSFDRFTIASKQVLVTYVHAGVFVPVVNPTASTLRFTFSPLNNPAMNLAYWDEDAYITELIVSTGDVPLATKSTKHNLPSAENEGLRPLKELEKSKKRKAETAAAPTVKKAAPSHLQFWSDRHAELHGLDQKTADANGSEDDKALRAKDAAPPSQSFADPQRNCCYLCSRQFNSTAEANRHERLSDLHQKNLKDATLVRKALGKLEKHGVQSQQSSIEYRDRAKERRKVYGVVNKKGEQIRSKANKPTSDEDEPIVQSKGASLLSKMGYTAGQGLGASGEGMTAPIAQEVYAAGVGLGAQGGKLGDAVTEAARNTTGDYGGFAEKTRETARERYRNM